MPRLRVYPEIRPEHLDPACLAAWIYPNLDYDYYWSFEWDPGFYAALARAGFISVSTQDEPPWRLLPQLQTEYAVLDWPQLRLNRHLRRYLRSGGPARDALRLGLNPDPRPVLAGQARYHGADSWLSPAYINLMEALAEQSPPGFRLVGVELRAGPERRLLAGELGYFVGRTYTSLTGFVEAGAPRGPGWGLLQMAALAKLLRRRGLAFWNLGHPSMDYKLALGARILPREVFLKRWLRAAAQPAVELPPRGLDVAVGSLFRLNRTPGPRGTRAGRGL